MAKRTSRKAPWDRENPKARSGKSPRKLTPAKKATAKARARRAGRPYPNLVDNMAVAKKSADRKSSAKKKTTAKRTRKAATKKR